MTTQAKRISSTGLTWHVHYYRNLFLPMFTCLFIICDTSVFCSVHGCRPFFHTRILLRNQKRFVLTHLTPNASFLKMREWCLILILIHFFSISSSLNLKRQLSNCFSLLQNINQNFRPLEICQGTKLNYNNLDWLLNEPHN